MKVHPLTNEVLSCRSNLIYWLIDMHSAVSREIGKAPYSYEKMIVDLFNKDESHETYIILISLILLFVIVIKKAFY